MECHLCLANAEPKYKFLRPEPPCYEFDKKSKLMSSSPLLHGPPQPPPTSAPARHAAEGVTTGHSGYYVQPPSPVAASGRGELRFSLHIINWLRCLICLLALVEIFLAASLQGRSLRAPVIATLVLVLLYNAAVVFASLRARRSGFFPRGLAFRLGRLYIAWRGGEYEGGSREGLFPTQHEGACSRRLRRHRPWLRALDTVMIITLVVMTVIDISNGWRGDRRNDTEAVVSIVFKITIIVLLVHAAILSCSRHCHGAQFVIHADDDAKRDADGRLYMPRPPQPPMSDHREQQDSML